MNKEILKFWKTQWEAYLKSFFAMQEQGEKMLELMLLLQEALFLEVVIIKKL